MPNTSEYYKQWYVENKELLNKVRRERYKVDPSYREAVRERNKVSREKYKEQKPAKDPESRSRLYRTVQVIDETTGQVVERALLTIGAVAKELGRSVQAVRLWEKKGLLPRTPLNTPRGDRLYTPEMLEIIRKQLTDLGRLDNTKARPRPPSSVVLKVRYDDGRVAECALYKIGVLSKLLKRSVVALEQLETKGVFPKSPLRHSATRYRLYTQEMLDVVKAALDTVNGDLRSKGNAQAFFAAVTDGWKKQKVLNIQVVDG